MSDSIKKYKEIREDKKDRLSALYVIESQIQNLGIHETLTNDNYEWLDDAEFHKLRNYYIQHTNLVENYIRISIERLENDNPVM